jgi:fumarate hydratase subunit alpha
MNTLKTIEDTAVKLMRRAACELPVDIADALKKGYSLEESGSVAKAQMEATVIDFEKAEELGLPMCQDSGIHIYYVELGEDVQWIKGTAIKEALVSASRRATDEVPMRPNAVHPFTGENTGNNIGHYIPFVNWEIVPGDKIKITVFPKGGGSENMSALAMLKPGEGIKGIKKFIVDTVIKAGGQPCPPIIVGIGIGGGADIAMKLAKKQLQRKIGERHEEKAVADLEKELLQALNMTGIGPQGLGGKTTCLEVFIDYAHRHPASLPVGISMQCWAARQASAIISADGNVELL